MRRPRSFRKIVDRYPEMFEALGRSIPDARSMLGEDVIDPLPDGVSEPADPDGHGGVGETTADLLDRSIDEFRIGVVANLTNYFFSVTRPSAAATAAIHLRVVSEVETHF